MTDDSNADHDGTDTRSIDAGSDCLIAEVRVPAESFVLGSTLVELSGVAVEFEFIVPTEGAPMPFLWVDTDSTAFATAAADDPTVENARCITRFDDSALYRIEWAEPDYGFLGWFRDGHATLLEADGVEDEWHLKLRVESREELGTFQTYCEEQDVRFELLRLYGLRKPKMGQFNVSEKQFEALTTAQEMGYFEIPRDASLDELAAELGVSPRAASERLRRGQTNLIHNSLMIGRATALGLD
ncbi:helix-turn-helix domain-containing protein [Halalkalicoccus tibetensis]|uniref:Helix-turn-helix domain-containing protein n=1 Tax=Halalkalicoccus tibetensis TaxID=175632 RepID=A0ABD5V6T6_9EURY